VPGLFRDFINKMSDDELNQFLEKFRRLRAERNQTRPDQSETSPCSNASNTSPDAPPPIISEESQHEA